MSAKAMIVAQLLLLVTICDSVTRASEPDYPSDIKTVLNTLLIEGTVKAELIGGINMTPKSAALVAKFRSAIQQNPDSIFKYLGKSNDSGNSRPDPAFLDMTEEEIVELGNILSNFDPVSTKETFEIVKSDSRITFKADGTLAELGSVTINTDDLKVSIGEYTLLLTDTVNIENDQNIMKSKWRGYTWRYEFPEDFDLSSLGGISQLSIKLYIFTIGKLEKNGKTYMSIKGRELIDGVEEIRFLYSLVF